MKPETTQRLRLSTASLVRAGFASAWFWEIVNSWQPPANDSLRRARRVLQRAAVKAKDDPLGFMEHLAGADWFTPDAKFPERAAVAGSEILDHFTEYLKALATSKAEFVLENSERKNLDLVLAFFGALAARPGRPGKDIYRRAVEFCLRNGKTPINRLCIAFWPGYSSMGRNDQRKARASMRSGVSRLLKAQAAQIAHRTKPPL